MQTVASITSGGPALRRATCNDAADLAALLLISFEEYRHLYSPPAFEASTADASMLAGRLDEGPTWVATIGDAIAGTLSCRISGAVCHLRSMAVHPQFRGRGIARQLLERGERWATSHRYTSLTLETTMFLTNAVNLYIASGFTLTGAQRDLGGTTVVAMQKPLAVDPQR